LAFFLQNIINSAYINIFETVIGSGFSCIIGSYCIVSFIANSKQMMSQLSPLQFLASVVGLAMETVKEFNKYQKQKKNFKNPEFIVISNYFLYTSVSLW
jgi:hypothetical protein